MESFEFWVTVAPLRSAYVADARRLVQRWISEPDVDHADELCAQLALAWLRLTPTDREGLLAGAHRLLAGPPLAADAAFKYELLRALDDGLLVVPDATDEPLA